MTDALPPLSRADSERIARRRRGRSIAIMLALLLVAAMFYALTIVKMHA